MISGFIVIQVQVRLEEEFLIKQLGDEYINLVKKVWFNSGEILSKYFEEKGENMK